MSLESDTSLMQALHFTAQDLDANRAGELSARQVERLRQMRNRVIGIGVSVSLALSLVATSLLFFGRRGDSTILTLIGIGVTIGDTALLWVFVRHWLRLGADLQGQEIEVLSGTVERTIRVSGRMTHYLLKIGAVEIRLPKDTLALFEHQTPYILYRTRHAQILLSAVRDKG